MAITELKKNVNINTSKIEFICPVCNAKKALDIPNSVIAEAKQLTTMSIARGLVCEHQFQAFVDKNFQVRGYQRVDFEIENGVNHGNDSNFGNIKKDEDGLFENLVLEGNYLEFTLKKTKSNKNRFQKDKKIHPLKKRMTLEEIYNEFREFIDEDNKIFREFINKDVCRTEPRYYIK